MPKLLIHPSLQRSFEHKVLPVLRARGMLRESNPQALLDRLIRDRQQIWMPVLERPKEGQLVRVPGQWREMETTGKGEPMFIVPIGDYLARLPQSAVPRGESVLRVGRSFGRRIFAEFAEADPADDSPASHERHVLLVSTSEITVLADLLPDRDALLATEVWPNENLPLRLLHQRRNLFRPSAAETLEPLLLDSNDGVWFAISCQSCRGSGSVSCAACNGAGTTDCPKCAGSGVYRPARSCPKCSGSGVYRAAQTCPNCGGSGSFIGKYGDRMGDCRRCHGQGGWPQINCSACEGRGMWPQQDCSLCEGRGRLDCRVCNATGHVECRRCCGNGCLRAGFQLEQGVFTERASRSASAVPFSPEAIAMYDWANRKIIEFEGGARGLWQRIEEIQVAAGQGNRAFEQAWRKHIAEFGMLHSCLNLSMEAEEIRETGAVELEGASASTARSPGRVTLEFRVCGKKRREWIENGEPPFPVGSALTMHATPNAGPLVLPLQGKKLLSEKDAPTFVGVRGMGKQMRLRIRFPAAIDFARLPEHFWIRRDAPPPAELAQARALSEWCSADRRTHPILRAILSSDVTTDFGALKLPSSPILDGNLPQAMAVALALSSAPLGLVKGPPGTGKTTVIEEVVTRMADSGKRVLICSESHQAVRNALERLHKAKRFRMLRWGREENLRGEDEHFYREENIASTFPGEVISGTDVRLIAKTAEIERLSDALSGISAACSAAGELASVRERLSGQRRQAEARLDKARAESEQQRERELAAAAERHASASRGPMERLEQCRASALALEKNEARLAGDAAQAKERFLKKTGRNPKNVDVPNSIGRRLRDTFMPDIFVSVEALEQRYSDAARKLDTCSSDLCAYRGEIQSVEQTLRKLTTERDERAQRARQLCDEQTAHARHTCADELSAFEREQREMENQTFPCRQAGLHLASEFAILPEAEPSMQFWNEVRGAAERRSVELINERDFMREWRDEIALPQSGDILAELYFRSTQVFFATCVGVRSWKRFAAMVGEVDLVIIDEAAQATIPQKLGPMLLGKRALLIGDERQLPPTGLMGERDLCRDHCPARCQEPHLDAPNEVSSMARMSPCWLERSFFEWLWLEKPHVPRVMLKRQFRMHPDISEFVGSVFYPEGLEDGVTRENRHLNFGEFTRAVCLISTSGDGKRRYESKAPGDDPGYWNDLEQQKVEAVLARAEATLDMPVSFGIITPYRHQVDRLRTKLGQCCRGFNKVILDPEADVASVNSYQGSQRDVIVISFVRSPTPCRSCAGHGCAKCGGRGFDGSGLSFVRDLRRLNVAFSRAKRMLILVGDIDALTDPRFGGGRAGARVLSRFFEYISNRGKVLRVWETKANPAPS